MSLPTASGCRQRPGNEFGAIQRQVIDPQVEAVGVGMSPHGSDRLPKLLAALLVTA
jgi:hypothetical protein